jgi:hypothetical protein
MACGWQRKERLGWQVRKERKAEGSPIMDDRANDGRGAWMASEGAGHGSGPTATRLALPTDRIEAVDLEWPKNQQCP